MSEPRNLHFVPKTYLRAFASRSGSHIWCFDKEQSKQYEPNIQGIAAIRDYYKLGEGVTRGNLAIIESASGLDIEHFFGDLESRYPIVRDSVIKSAKSLSPVNREHIDYLIDFIYFQDLRTSDLESSLEDMIFMSGVSALDLARSISTDGDKYSNEIIVAAAGKVAEKLARDAKLRVEIIFSKELYVPVRDRLKSMSWSVLEAQESYFITSDHPVHKLSGSDEIEHGLGLLSPHLELFFPLTPRYALAINDPLHHTRNQLSSFNFRRVGRNYVEEYNRLQVIRANRQVFSHVPVQGFCRRVMDGKVNIRSAQIVAKSTNPNEGMLVEANNSYKYILIDKEKT